jgi:hypothetical protein
MHMRTTLAATALLATGFLLARMSTLEFAGGDAVAQEPKPT